MREQGVANMESKTGEEAGSSRDGNAWTRVGRLRGEVVVEEEEKEEEGDLQPLAAAPTGAGVPAAGGGGR